MCEIESQETRALWRKHRGARDHCRSRRPAERRPDGSHRHKHSVAEAGSDTSYWMMEASSARVQRQHHQEPRRRLRHPDPAGQHRPVPGRHVSCPATPCGGVVAVDSSVAGQPPTPPDGSSAGITALNGDTLGNIDFARSSRGPNAGETPALKFWAYALGAADYVTFPGTHAPARGSRRQQLINIYTCSPTRTHLPIISNWSQVGGTAGVIKKYQPQAGSGTRSFVVSKLLNGNDIDANCDAAHMRRSLQEHDARGVTAASKPNAIYFFDWAAGTAQAHRHRGQPPQRGHARQARNHRVRTARRRPARSTRPAVAVPRNPVHLQRGASASHPAGYTKQRTDVEKLIGVGRRPTERATSAPAPQRRSRWPASSRLQSGRQVEPVSRSRPAG